MIDRKTLINLADMAAYYHAQIGQIATSTHSGLTAEHEELHITTLHELELLTTLLKLYITHQQYLEYTTFEYPDSGEKEVTLSLRAIDMLTEYEREVNALYSVQILLDHSMYSNTALSFGLKLKQENNGEGGTVIPISEIIYSLGEVNAEVSPYAAIEKEDVIVLHRLSAPKITNEKSSSSPLPNGQDSELFIPDLHARIVDLFITVKNLQ